MPTSQPRTLTPVHLIIQSLNPRSMIDLGVGHGKTGVLAREYLDIMKYRYKPEQWQTKIFGIEVFSEYKNPLWDYAYDEILIGDALEILHKLPKVDLIVALDIWEHFNPTYANEILTQCLARAHYLLISTPKKPLLQGDVFGNDAERHVSHWHPRDFSGVSRRFVFKAAYDWIILLSSQADIPHSLFRYGGWGTRLGGFMRDGFRKALTKAKKS